MTKAEGFELSVYIFYNESKFSHNQCSQSVKYSETEKKNL